MNVLTPGPARRAVSLGALALATALAVTACAGSPSGAASGSPAAGAVAVVATTTQVADFTRQVGGDLIDLTELVQPNQSAHQLDPSAADLMAMERAAAVVESGAGLETWLPDALSSAGFHGTLIDASQGVTLSGSDDHDHAEEGDDHASEDADHDHAEEGDDHASEEPSASEDAHHDHDETGENPHIWTDPNNAIVMVQNIAEGLATVDPANADTYRANAATYENTLRDLDSWIAASVDQVPADQRLVVSNHDAFHYYLDHYGITFVGSIMPSFEDNAEPSAAALETLVNDIKTLGVKAIFSETSINPQTAQSIADAAGVKVYSGDDALYGDSLGTADSDGATYVAATIHNTRMIVESWGYETEPLPASLAGLAPSPSAS